MKSRKSMFWVAALSGAIGAGFGSYLFGLPLLGQK